MILYREVELKQELCDIYAEIEGCEPGDHLRLLAECLKQVVGGGYSLSNDDEKKADILNKLLDEELAVFKAILPTELREHASEDHYQDTIKAIAACEKEIESFRKAN